MGKIDAIEVTWRHVERLSGLDVWLGQQADGKWLAARTRQPRFCFEADTAEAASNKAKREIRYWRSKIALTSADRGK